jgi:predicted O-methyltransferase YrrM
MSLALHYLLWNCGLSPATTQTTETERHCLEKHASGRKIVVEIGVFQGVTTSVLRRAMAADGVIYAIDPFRTGRLGISFLQRIAHGEVGRVSNGTVEWIRALGCDAVNDPRVAGVPVDFVFVDGDHTWEAVEGDWNAWSGKVVPGGIIAVHDSRESEGAPSELYAQQVIVHDPRFVVVDTVGRLTVLQRRDTK